MNGTNSHGARAAGVLALLGATVGPLLDGLHTWSGATWYPNAQWLKSVWWCPPLFCFAALAIGLGRLVTERQLKRRSPRPSTRDVAVTLSVFIAVYGVSGFWSGSEPAKAALFLISFAATWWWCDRTLVAVLGALAAGLGGWLVEHTLVGQGLFFHRDVMLDGVALWIPPLYFCAALAIGSIARRAAYG